MLVWERLFFLGGVAFIVGSVMDTLDGRYSRMSGKGTPFGAFLDSTLDRVEEGIVLTGVVGYFALEGNRTAAAGVVIAVLASLMVSYTRARAEALGVECKVGIATRPVRVVILSIGLLFAKGPRSALRTAGAGRLRARRPQRDHRRAADLARAPRAAVTLLGAGVSLSSGRTHPAQGKPGSPRRRDPSTGPSRPAKDIALVSKLDSNGRANGNGAASTNGAARYQSEKVRVAIVGVGNCASAFVQGVNYYKDADPSEQVPGLMHVDLGGYHISTSNSRPPSTST